MPNFEGFSRNEVNDGFFELKYKPDGVYIIVHPSIGNGKKVTSSDVLDKLNRKKIRNYDRIAIENAVMKANQIPQKIAEPQEEARIDASLAVNIAPDKMKASIIITPPEGGRMLTIAEINQRIVQSGIVYGIKQDVIEMMAKNPIYNQLVTVAEGLEPVNGVNGKLEFHFDIHKDAKPSIMEDGRVNFRELNLIENVKKGQVLVTATDPLPGQPGKNVVGGIIQALNGKMAVMPKGKNTTVSEDGKSLLSLLDGQVNYIDGKVNVFSLYEVPADVDNSTGNIYFVGNVIVHGNVLSGFILEAGGNVEVCGVVEGAQIKAGGNIILRRGMQGAGKGVLISEGDIVARYIEHATIHAKGDIKAEAIMHSNVKCGRRLELSGKKGLLVGGVSKVGREVSAKVIGSPMATVTEIEVGVDPELRERYKVVKDEIKAAESDILKADQAIELLQKLEKVGKLTPEKKEILEKSLRTKIFYSSKLEELKEELVKIEEGLEQEADGRILAQSIIYPGTRVAIGSCLMNVRENLQYCTLYRDGADVRVGGYNG